MNEQRDKRNHDDDVDLTGMIQAYSQDDTLRKKIEEMKKQKEAAKKPEATEGENINPLTGETYQSSIYDAQVSSVTEKAEEYTATTASSQANYETLNILGSKATAATFTEDVEKTKVMPKEENVYEDADGGKTIVSKRTYEAQPMTDNNVDDEDVEENGSEDKQMNKVITYVIIGIISIVLIIGVIFGVRFLYNAFLAPGETPVEEVNQTDKEEDEEDEPETDITDNTAKINALEKQKATYEEQLTTAKSNLEAAKKAQDEANKTIDGLTTKKTQLQEKQAAAEAAGAKLDEANRKLDELNDKVNAAREAMDNADEANKPTYRIQWENACTERDQYKEVTVDPRQSEYQKLVDEVANLTSAFGEEQKAAQAKLKEAKENITKYEDQIGELEQSIQDIDSQLAELQK